MNKFFFYIIFWIIIQIIINIKMRNPINSQCMASSLNSFILIVYYLFLPYLNKSDNILLFSSYYISDLVYYIIFYITDIDLKYNSKKKDRIVYSVHHLLTLILLYITYTHVSNEIILKYSNIFILLFEISTLFMNLEILLKKKFFFKLSFIICRIIFVNFFLYNLILKEKIDVKKVYKYTVNSILSFLSMYNIFYIFHAQS